MQVSTTPILYTFRRCPYAIRARLALLVSQQTVEIREVVLRDKAPEFLQTSPSASVPCLKIGESVIDESLDIMLWALEKSDPEGWLKPQSEDLTSMRELVNECDGPFKQHLDRYKYHNRYKDADQAEEQAQGAHFLKKLDKRLQENRNLFGNAASLADFAILPFVRQFANADREWFDLQEWLALKVWLETFESSSKFNAVMPKWPKWVNGSERILFP